MTFAVIHTQNGDLIADFDSHDEAVDALREYVVEHPSVSDQVGLMEFDDGGRPVGEFVPASTFASGYEQYA